MTILERLFKSRQDTPIIPPVELTMGGPPIDTPDELIPEDPHTTEALANIAGLSFVINYENSCHCSRLYGRIAVQGDAYRFS